MRYWVRAVIGLAICAAAVVGIDWGIYHLVRTGSCGSSTTYVTTRPCPPGTGGHILALIGGIFGGLIGLGVWATRGDRGRPSPIPLAAIMWSLLFVTLAASTAYSAFGPANNHNSGARTTAIILAAIFVPMGLAPLPLAFGGRRKQERATRLAAQGSRCPGVVVSVEDTGITINDNPHVKITVRAEPPGEAPFTVVKTATVSRVRIPRAGDACVVLYDPADREHDNGITFDPVPGFPYVPAPDYRAPGAGAPAAVAASAATAAGAAPASDDDDPLEKIAQLGKLRDQGLVTAEEFEEQKKRLLAEL
jgi:hypothetical protein